VKHNRLKSDGDTREHGPAVVPASCSASIDRLAAPIVITSAATDRLGTL
jgi:hypothetical protein